MKRKISVLELKKYLRYDDERGCLIWNERDSHDFVNVAAYVSWNKRFANKVVGSKNTNGHVVTRVKNVPVLVHIAVYAIVTGEYPNDEIDHIDHDKTNNRMNNLRVVSRVDNSRNMPKRIDNKTGETGVFFDKSRSKYVAQVGGRNLGRFNTVNEAAVVAKEARLVSGYHQNHGVSI